ncbi:hypothetical protein Q5P01_011131 [Channa striata]|uniref:Uncharacterized protein n=1 Tax=Channa striata TaxID=64152 RepID=A0AA88MYN0_CHASR|nr:hypothetical protein Q5P01_011131 [Channa striata]
MFPSFRSPDDPHTGVRAASQPFPSPLVPNNAPDVTVLSKTIGGPYRREILETTRKKAVMWPGEHGFLDTVLPNAKLRDCDLSLSERTSNILKNLERALWITSYQMDYTGSGPANPLKIDDYKEKMSDLGGMNSHSAPLRERSCPMFVPSKPKKEWRRRPGSFVGRSAGTPSSPTVHQHGPQEIIAKHNETPDVNPKGFIQSGNSTGAQNAELSQDVLNQQQREHKSKIQFDRQHVDTEDLYKCPPPQREKDGEKRLTKHSKERHSLPTVAKEQTGNDSRTEILSRAASEGRELSCSISNPPILPRPPVRPGNHPEDRLGTVGREGAALSLLALQNSFSKSEAHRNFNSSITHAAVNLRDNTVTGKKHDFFGVNCYYLTEL